MRMKLGKSGWLLWGLYGAFAVYAVAIGVQAKTFVFSGPLGGIKAMVWLALFVFLAYSVYCSVTENFFRSVRSIASLQWGRQIGADLYLGLCLSLLIIYLNDGFWVAVVWLLPILIYANLAVLLYVALHFDSIAARFLGA
ncbi:MAG: hypothetical protein AAGA33_07490 [Pseudomonadota bacterium]